MEQIYAIGSLALGKTEADDAEVGSTMLIFRNTVAEVYRSTTHWLWSA